MALDKQNTTGETNDQSTKLSPSERAANLIEQSRNLEAKTQALEENFQRKLEETKKIKRQNE